MPVALPKSSEASGLADWAELTILTAHSAGLSRARIINLLNDDGTREADVELAGEGEPEYPEAAEAEALDRELDTDLDARVEQLLDEVAARKSIGPSVYPFAVDDERVVLRGAPGAPAYFLLLILSVEHAPYRKAKRTNDVEHAYDLLALEAVRRFLGRGAEAVRFARNSNDPDDPVNTRPKRFDEAIRWLRERLDLGRGLEDPHTEEEEEHWEFPGPGLQPLTSYSDAGVDVVAWWRFKDGRIGFPVLLAQCTVQLRWERKLKDVDPDLWRGWINFGTVPPQKCLVIPFAVDLKEENWPHRTTQAGVIIDRVRFVELLDELAEEDLAGLVDSGTQRWVDRELGALR